MKKHPFLLISNGSGCTYPTEAALFEAIGTEASGRDYPEDYMSDIMVYEVLEGGISPVNLRLKTQHIISREAS